MNVQQSSLEEDHTSSPVKVVSKEGREGSFGFTTEKQGEFRFCFHNEAPGVDHELEIEFKLKVGYEAKDYTEVAKKEHLKPIELELLKLNDAAAELLSDLTHIRQREVTILCYFICRFVKESVCRRLIVKPLTALKALSQFGRWCRSL